MERKGGRTNKYYESKGPSRVGLNIKLQQASWASSDLSTQTGLEFGGQGGKKAQTEECGHAVWLSTVLR